MSLPTLRARVGSLAGAGTKVELIDGDTVHDLTHMLRSFTVHAQAGEPTIVEFQAVCHDVELDLDGILASLDPIGPRIAAS